LLTSLHWYLVAWDVDKEAWRTFRVDRISPRLPAGPRFTPRALPPDEEIAAHVARGAGQATGQHRAGDRARFSGVRSGPAADSRGGLVAG
jgi:predicted DNA-binding transcriptional regulator YafY